VHAFAQLGLGESIIASLDELGYETPTPIQKETIPVLLEGRDIIGQAQTGTGKTAAFVLPILQRIDPKSRSLQALILTPTRELAIQVAEAVHTYSKHMGGIRVMPVYGGDSIQRQISRLRAGMHVVVGTPGRIIDHLRRGTLDLSQLQFAVLDEADEMLNMGFLEDVGLILEHAPETRQTALFSATMPSAVRRIAEKHLRNPEVIDIKRSTLNVPAIEQQYLHVPQRQKLDALTQVLELEASAGESILIFARTKLGCAELVEKLQARGYAAEAIHGDMNQQQRESVVRRLRSGQLEIVAGTDVAARGLDVERITLVINYDMPSDTESYVHRIGRTGRAGREGKAILFVTPRESRMLKEIERYTGQKLTPVRVPTKADVAARRTRLFKDSLMRILDEEDLDAYLALVESVAEEAGRDMAEVAAAAARLARGDSPLVAVLEQEEEIKIPVEQGMVRIFLNAGRETGVRPADIVGAVANEANIPGRSIGAIDIHENFSILDVPAEFAAQVLRGMQGALLRGQEARVRLADAGDPPPRETSHSARKSAESAAGGPPPRGRDKMKKKVIAKKKVFTGPWKNKRK
jgi:ATP-dependent RNA helicase DeaD